MQITFVSLIMTYTKNMNCPCPYEAGDEVQLSVYQVEWYSFQSDMLHMSLV